MLASPYFARSPRLSRFLEFTVAQALAGSADSLKEYSIGVEVFGRKPSFDPQADAIVRVTAVTLRSRVSSYFANEGRDDPVLIEFAKGGYAPAIRSRSEAGRNATPEPAPDSIAVLPFVNMSSDPENEYFSDGLTEELISALSNVHGLRVVARTSVFKYKGKAADARQIGSDLNARMVLEGSVRKAGDRLRITAQLIDALNGYHTWSRSYRVEMTDLFSVQQEIASAIASTLRGGDERRLKWGSANLDAYHSYLKGRFYLNKWTAEGFQRSIEFFEAAIRQEPEMAAAYSGLADARFVLACYGQSDPRDLMPKAREAAERAMELGSSLAEPHISLGAVRAIYDWDWQGAEDEFLHALQLDPDCATAYQWYGMLCLLPQGRLQEAEAAIQRARELDPLSPPINTSLGLLYFVQGRHDDAIEYFEKALEIDAKFYLAHWWLGTIYLQRSMMFMALKAFRKAGVLTSAREPDVAGFSYQEALIGKSGKARQVLDHLMRLSRQQYVSPVMIAAVQVALGEKEAAFRWLRKAQRDHDAWVAWLGADHRFDELRPDKRFTALLNKLRIGEIPRVSRTR